VPPASVPAFGIGDIVGDTYKIERELGRGGMGIVLLASHLRLPGKQVAIKVLDAKLASDDVLARFKREAHIVSVLAHPNIVHIEDFNVTPEGTPYLVLEYLRGESLAQRIAQGPLDTEHALSIARQIGAALSVAHAHNIVHRDLKPHNVFLVATQVDGRDATVVKVLDFGISKMLDSDTVKTEESALLGTPQYMAPEQATGQNDEIGVRTDLFSLGEIVYEMLAGRPAFAGTNVPEVVFKVVYEQPTPLPAHVPATISAAIGQAMAKAPAERFGSVSAFIEALTGQSVSASLPPVTGKPALPRVAELAATEVSAPMPRQPRPTNRRRLLILAGGAIAVTAVIVVALIARSPGRQAIGDARLRSIAAQLTAGSEVVIDATRYPVDLTDGQLHIVKFEVGGHPYEAIEQNPQKRSRWAKLAREGHRVVQFRDIETKRYIAVVVDGEPRRPTQGEPDDP
jgi:serine/threonine-protein kinase